MVHMKSVLVTIVSAKAKCYEKLIIYQQIISVRSNVITVVSPVQLFDSKLVLSITQLWVVDGMVKDKTGLRPKNRSWSWSCRSFVVL